MKACACCGMTAAIDEKVCSLCGEASWTRVNVEEPQLQLVQEEPKPAKRGRRK